MCGVLALRPIAVLLAAAVLSAVAACGSPDRATDAPPSYTHAEAVSMVEDILQAATRDMSPRPTLEILGGGDVPCDGPNDDEPTDLVMYERTYWLRKVPITMNASITDQLKRYWTANGYVKGFDDMNDVAQAPGTVMASNRTTGFHMKLVKGTNGDLSLTAQSPCVNEQGSSAPS